jgi:hypothetical protein
VIANPQSKAALEYVPGGRFDLTLSITDPEVVEELRRRLDPEERLRFALSALRVGVLALKSAGGAIDERAIREAGDRLIQDVKIRLDDHRQCVTSEIASSLKSYFDRQTGAFPSMVEGLVGPSGRLPQLLDRHLVGDGSALARTLLQHVGKDSPLFRLLSPEQKDGLLAKLDESVRHALDAQRTALLGQFDLNQPQSALARLVQHMRDGTTNLGAAFEQTIGRLTSEFSLDVEASSLSRFKRELGRQIGDMVSAQTVFQTQVLKDLEGIRARRAVEEQTTRKGFTFEAALGDWLRVEAARRGEVFDETGTRVGEIKNCKKGDFVLELGPESVAPGERIVFEAKDVGGCALREAREELAVARPNRKAQVGVFVLARTCVSAGTPPFQRFGEDLVVVWDPEQQASDVWLGAACEVARALVVRRARASAATTASFDDLDRYIGQLEKDANLLDNVLASAGTIKSAANRIEGDAGNLRKKLADAAVEIREGVNSLRPRAP